MRIDYWHGAARWIVIGIVLSVAGACSPWPCHRVHADTSQLGYTFADVSEFWTISYDPDHGEDFALFLYNRGDSTLVRFVMHSDRKGGERYRTLLDEIWVPLQGSDTFVGGAMCPCYRGRKADIELFALMRGPQCGTRHPLRLWRASRHRKRIEEIDPRGVHCECRCL